MQKIYKSGLSAAIHEAASDLYDVGIMDRKTMREFDESCLIKPPVPSPAEIRTLREREHISQTVFAKYLNVTQNLVSDWERGVKKPGGPATLLLALVKQGGLGAVRWDAMPDVSGNPSVQSRVGTRDGIARPTCCAPLVKSQ